MKPAKTAGPKPIQTKGKSMKANRTGSLKSHPLTSALALLAVATSLLLGTAVRAAAGQPIVTHLDFSYVNTTLCDFPLLIHFKAVEITQFNPATGKYTSTFNTRTEYTNLE